MVFGFKLLSDLLHVFLLRHHGVENRMGRNEIQTIQSQFLNEYTKKKMYAMFYFVLVDVLWVERFSNFASIKKFCVKGVSLFTLIAISSGRFQLHSTLPKAVQTFRLCDSV